jgi:hypothetical protein
MSIVTMSLMATPTVAVSSAVERSSFIGASVQGLPALRTSRSARALTVTANTRKILVKEPLGEWARLLNILLLCMPIGGFAWKCRCYFLFLFFFGLLK